LKEGEDEVDGPLTIDEPISTTPATTKDATPSTTITFHGQGGFHLICQIAPASFYPVDFHEPLRTPLMKIIQEVIMSFFIILFLPRPRQPQNTTVYKALTTWRYYQKHKRFFGTPHLE
jgi:hypothetical protein